MMIIFRGGFIVVNTSLLVVHSNSATTLTYFTTQLIHTGTAQQSDQPASLIFRSSSDPNWISCCLLTSLVTFLAIPMYLQFICSRCWSFDERLFKWSREVYLYNIVWYPCVYPPELHYGIYMALYVPTYVCQMRCRAIHIIPVAIKILILLIETRSVCLVHACHRQHNITLATNEWLQTVPNGIICISSV